MEEHFHNTLLAVSNCTITTRMHSSRMRTGRSLTVCRSQLPGGCLLWGGVCSWGGVSAPRGVSVPRGVSALGVCVYSQGGLLPGVSAPGGVCSRGGVSQDALRQRPPLWTESQTPVKTLPWPNFVAAGKKQLRLT